MTGICINKLSHSCGTRKGLQVFADKETGKVNGFCFSCKTFVANPYGKPVTADEVELPEPKSEAEIKQEMEEAFGLPTVDCPTRKLRAKNLEQFGIKTALSEADGKTPAAMYFPIEKKGEITGFYVKTLSDEPIQYAIGDVKDADPFGWSRAKRSGSYRLYIVEGKEDAPATEAIFERHGDPKYHPAIISLTNGVNSLKKNLGDKIQEINRLFKEVILVFDNDKAGKAATQEAMLLFPKASTVVLPDKDPNACVLNGSTKAAYKALAFQATTPKNTRLIRSGPALHLSARTPTPYGEFTWPYPTLNKVMRGMRTGETVYAGAGVKMGKSELLNDLGSHLMKAHNIPVFAAKPEEENKKSYKMFAGKMVGERFHDPDCDFDYEKYDKAGEMIGDKLMLVDLYQHMGWDSLKQDIVYAANEGARAVFIDPITNLTAGMSPGDANTFLTGVTRDLSSLAMDMNFVAFIFCHLKAPEGNISAEQRAKKYRDGQYVKLGNCPHERGGDVLSAQFAGSRAMMQSCNLMLGLEGNKDPELPDEVRNMRYLTILEDREFGNSNSIPLYWNKNTTFFKEV